MRTSQLLLATLKETPADAEVISHQLMLRAGLVRKLASGLYSWLPLGLKVLRKVENIVREEMNATGAQEVLMPVVQPAELWQESGRWEKYGPELLRIQDRHSRDFCLGPTHEEIITDIVRNELQSYKQLPLNLYQIQTKFRDEVRPRFGIMRGREFTMKDSYSFHLSQDCLQNTYEQMYTAYSNIFSRLGLNFRPVIADTGSIGGDASHEFHVLADSGEDDIAFSNRSNYAANVEMAAALPMGEPSAPTEVLKEVDTGHANSIEEVAQTLGIEPQKILKTIIVKGANEDTPLVALCIRGDLSLNEIKAEKHNLICSPFTLASDNDVEKAFGCKPGTLGPANLSIPIIADYSAAAMADFCCGANRPNIHLCGANWQRDANYTETCDIRNVVAGDPSPDGNGSLDIKRGIEVGHIFQLGNKYSKALNATVLNENGKAEIMTMGCYGIGVSRTVAAAIEQNYDDKGIIWPPAMAPFQLVIVPLNMQKSEQVKATAERLYQEAKNAGIDVLLDDRNERPGVKFADMELIGIPHRIVVGDRGLKNNQLEYKARNANQAEDIALEGAINFITQALS